MTYGRYKYLKSPRDVLYVISVSNSVQSRNRYYCSSPNRRALGELTKKVKSEV